MRPSVLLSVLAWLLVASLLLAPSRGPSAPPPTAAEGALQGDVDCDGAVNSVDSLQILRSAAGLPASADCLAEAGDVDCSQAVNAVDSLRILRHVAGLPNETPDGCVPIGEPLTPSPSSLDLIDEALANGEISPEEALTYGVYASFGDTRLPAQYKGDDSRVRQPPSGLLLEPEGLSAETKALLYPFKLPPSAPDSWYYLDTVSQAERAEQIKARASRNLEQLGPVNWTSIPSAGGKIKLWWDDSRFPERKGLAQTLAPAVDSFWQQLVQLLGRLPTSDVGLENNGGDALYDIYLTGIAADGRTQPYRDVLVTEAPCGPVATFTEIDARKTVEHMLSTLAHELFHAFQWVFPSADSCGDVNWFDEATAAWSEDYLRPQANTEHEFDGFFKQPYVGLPQLPNRGYNAYPFFLYLARQFSPDVMRQIHEQRASKPILQAINDAIEGGFAARLPEFALNGWNRAPFDWFKQADGIQAAALSLLSAGQTGDVNKIELNGEAEAALAPALQAIAQLGVQYYHFKVTDPQVALIQINNIFSDLQGITFQMMKKVAGQDWTVQDLSNSLNETVCLLEENVQEMVLVIANGRWNDSTPAAAHADPIIKATNSCYDWTGEVTYTSTQACDLGQAPHSDLLLADLSAGGLAAGRAAMLDGCPEHTLTVTATDLRFARLPGEGGDGQVFQLVSGKVEWEYEWLSLPSPYFGCRATSQGSLDIQAGTGTLTISPPGGGQRTYSASASNDQRLTASGTNCQGWSCEFEIGQWLSTGPDARPYDGGAQIQGEYSITGPRPGYAGEGVCPQYPSGPITAEYHWTLQRTSEQ